MTFIACIPDDGSNAAATAMYDKVRDSDGKVSNMFPPFAYAPAVLDGWNTLMPAVRGELDLRRYELITLAAARALKSSYCLLAHGTVLLKNFYPMDELAAIARDYRSAGLPAADVALMAYAEKVVIDAASIRQADIDELRDLGVSDREIFLAAAAAAMRCFFSKTADALGVQPDGKYAELPEELRESLVIGRPIAE